VARAMSNFGFYDLRLVNPYDAAFKEARSAVNAHYLLETARLFSDVGEAVADCTLVVGSTSVGHRSLHVPLYRLETAAQLIHEQGRASVALLFGSEKFGLSNEDISHCHWLLRIPTREEHGSMNLGQATAICLYELQRSAAAERFRYAETELATQDDYERLTQLLLDALSLSGYIHEPTRQSSELKIRRLIRRLVIPRGDAETWLGMVRQLLWKLKKGDTE
jgi:TrmH family RNA methyltransferase